MDFTFTNNQLQSRLNSWMPFRDSSLLKTDVSMKNIMLPERIPIFSGYRKLKMFSQAAIATIQLG